MDKEEIKKKIPMKKLLDFLAKLDNANIHYTLEHNRAETIMVLIAVPGERWEVEFFISGNVEIEIFKSYKDMKVESELEYLFEKFSD